MRIQELRGPKITMPMMAAGLDFGSTRHAKFKNSENSKTIGTFEQAYYNLKQQLKRQSWHYLDEGYFSMVLENPKKPYILKINMKQDTGYARFVRLVKQHPNPHFPKISDIRRLIFDDQVYYIYLIEKLQRDTTPRGKNIAEGCRKVVDFHNTPLEQLFPDYDGVLAYLKRRPKLVEALRLIGESSNNYSIDLGSANFMYRPDHTLVITDPYAD